VRADHEPAARVGFVRRRRVGSFGFREGLGSFVRTGYHGLLRASGFVRILRRRGFRSLQRIRLPAMPWGSFGRGELGFVRVQIRQSSVAPGPIGPRGAHDTAPALTWRLALLVSSGRAAMPPAEALSIADHRNLINRTAAPSILCDLAIGAADPDIGATRCYMSGDGLDCGRRDSMSTTIIELYDALKEAGASDEKARAAARRWPTTTTASSRSQRTCSC
jgi:hypothetical protein